MIRNRQLSDNHGLKYMPWSMFKRSMFKQLYEVEKQSRTNFQFEAKEQLSLFLQGIHGSTTYTLLVTMIELKASGLFDLLSFFLPKAVKRTRKKLRMNEPLIVSPLLPAMRIRQRMGNRRVRLRTGWQLVANEQVTSFSDISHIM